MTIRILPPDVAAKIAAGEVVERSANAAKELIENSLDAGATELRVEIREGGRRLLRVIDNGQGMTAEDAALAFVRHATSKLQSAEDLEAIRSFGFRGEALYSIAAVSHVLLTTRHKGDDFATQLRLEGGNLVAQNRAGAPVGTAISIEHLFFNTPARAKFLRSPASEAGQISAIIHRYALAYPNVRFSLVNDGRLVFQSNGNGDRYDVLVKLYGLEEARQMVKIGVRSAELGVGSAELGVRNGAEDSLDDDITFMAPTDENNHSALRTPNSALLVTGYVSLPVLTRPNRGGISLYVNQRYIEDRSLTHAIVQAYHTLLPGGRYPVAVILIDLDPSQVDVNVHPQKTQVRFVEDRRIYHAVQKAVRQAVVESAPVPLVSSEQLGVPNYAGAEKGGARPAGGEWQPTGRSTPEVSDHWQRATSQPNLDAEWNEQPPPSAENVQEAFELYPPPAQRASAEYGGRSADATVVNAPRPEGTRPLRAAQLPPLRVVGQIGAMYIIAEGPDGMFLIDQHAAHERILYEKFMTERNGGAGTGVSKQHLLEPLTLHMGSTLAGLVAQHLHDLNQLGFEIDAFGGATFLVRATPSVLSGEDPLRLLDEIATSLADRRNLVGETLEARLVKMVCKRAAIKAGQLLSDIEMQELVRQLEECQSPRTCPHGRPTMIQLSAGELEKAFGRT